MSRSTSRPTGTSRAIRVAVKLQSEKTKQCRWIAMLWSRCCWRQNLQADALLTTPPKNVDLLSFSWTKRPRQNSSVWRTCRSTNWDLEQSGIDSQKSGSTSAGRTGNHANLVRGSQGFPLGSGYPHYKIPLGKSGSGYSLYMIPLGKSGSGYSLYMIPLGKSGSGYSLYMIPLGKSGSGYPLYRIPLGKSGSGYSLYMIPLGKSGSGYPLYRKSGSGYSLYRAMQDSLREVRIWISPLQGNAEIPLGKSGSGYSLPRAMQDSVREGRIWISPRPPQGTAGFP